MGTSTPRTWPPTNGWLGIAGPKQTTHGAGQDARIQARLLRATYHPLDHTVNDGAPHNLIVHHHKDSTPADAGQVLAHVRQRKARVVLDAHTDTGTELLAGIVPAAIAHCPHCYHRLRQQYDRVTLIPQPGYARLQGPAQDFSVPEPVKTDLKTEFTIGWWGSVAPYKGLKRLVRILKHMRDHRDKPNVGVAAFGMLDPLHQLYPEEVRSYCREMALRPFYHLDLQWRPLDTVAATLSACDIFCLPSHRAERPAPARRRGACRGHARAACFLLSLGKPVLVSPDPEFDTVRPFCLTVPDGSAEQFALWARALLVDSSLYQQYTERSRDFVRAAGQGAYADRLREFLDAVM